MKQLIWATLAAGSAFLWMAHQSLAQQDKPITVTRLFTGPDGLTHAEKINLKLNHTKAGPARSDIEAATSVRFNRIPAGLFEDWHRAAERRYVITLSGRAELEIAGGQKVIADPGSIILADDTTGKGHTALVGRDEDWVSVFVPLAVK